MEGAFCFCSDRKEMIRKVRRDKNNFQRILQQAYADPLNELARESIISGIYGITNLEILEIGDFMMEKSLGSGTSSDVYLLVRKIDGEKFAGKFVNREVGNKVFTNEAKILKSCSTACASIVNLIGIMTTPKCLVLEFYLNGNLKQALQEDDVNLAAGKRTEFPFLRRLSYILDLCSAVHWLHRANICHRDIAMRNLLLSDDKKHVVLTDFSMSRILNSAIKEQSTLAPLVPTISPPETFRNKTKFVEENCQRWYSLKSDIWSLGVAMYEIIHKKELNDIRKRLDMPNRFPTERLPSKKVFNRKQDLWILILRCWNESPEDRPSSWDVLESIGMLVADPLDVKHEYNGYIRAPRTRYGAVGYQPSMTDTYSSETSFNACRSISNVHNGNPCGSFYFEDSSSCMLTEVVHSSIMPSMMKDFFRKLNSQSRLYDLGINEDVSIGHVIKQRQFKDKDHGDPSRKHFIKSTEFYRPKNIRSSQKIIPAHIQRLNSPSHRNNSISLKSVSELITIEGWKSMSRVETTTSMLSSSLRSEEPLSTKRVEYCSPLSVSSMNSATNMRCCKNRHFFSMNLTVSEKPNSSGFLCTVDPKSDTADEQLNNSCIIYAL